MEDDANGPMDQLSAHLDRGWDRMARGDLAGARLSAEKSLEIAESSPEAHNLIGYVCAAEGRADEALEHYRQAIDHDESYVEAMLNAAEVLLHPLRRFDEALALVEDALDWAASDDETADAVLLKIDALLAQGEREAARRALDQLPDGPFENEGLAFAIGRARFECGDAEGAEAPIRAATQVASPHSDAFYYLGLVLDAKGDSRGALAAFLQSRELDVVSPRPPWAVARDVFERRVQAALGRLSETAARALDGALVVVSDLPGPEAVADGLDPRILLLLDDLSAPGSPPRVGRLFVYQRNLERLATGLLEVEDEVVRAVELDFAHAFASPAGETPARA